MGRKREREREHMLESEAIKTAICCFSSQSSHITSSFRLPTRAISTRLLPCTILNYTFTPPPDSHHPAGRVQPALNPVLPLCDWLGKHIWAESWQLSSFIPTTCPSVGQRLGGGSAKGKTRQQRETTGHCHIWWVSLWGRVGKLKNSPTDSLPQQLHTVQLMPHVRLVAWSGANLREEAKEKWAGPLGEKFRGLSNGLLPASAHMDGHNT